MLCLCRSANASEISISVRWSSDILTVVEESWYRGILLILRLRMLLCVCSGGLDCLCLCASENQFLMETAAIERNVQITFAKDPPCQSVTWEILTWPSRNLILVWCCHGSYV